MKFTKMQGCGNDYVYINCFEETVTAPEELAKRISDRHFGVGGDGLILIEPSDRADAFMHMFNLDGSEGSMCGNGIRCVAKYIYDHGIIPADRREALIDTKSGVKHIRFHVENGKLTEAEVDMGEVRLDSLLPEPILVEGLRLQFVGINVGNPHAVYFLEDNPVLGVQHTDDLDFSSMGLNDARNRTADNEPVHIRNVSGHDFECHPRFPDKVNSEFIEILDRREIRFRVWERGSGETLACGTGATASVAAGVLAGKLDSDTEVTVHLLGGDLKIRYDSRTKHAFMTGPAVEVFTGDYPA